MAPENFSHKPAPARGSARWTAASSSPARPNRLAFRLIGIPVLAVAGVLLYSGLRDYFILPECDSARAKNTLADIFKQLKFEPQSLEPIKTISTSKDQVVCNAALPLADGATLNVDYSFFWQGNKANMKYSISRKAAQSSAISPSLAATALLGAYDLAGTR
jgi:hypothetical protein